MSGRIIDTGGRPLREMVSPPQVGPNPLQQALDDYHRMAEHVRRIEGVNRDLSIQNAKLVSEVQMLREAVERSDRDRIRLQAVASTFGGQARSLSAIFNDIVALAIKHGIEAVEAATPDPDLERAAGEAQEIIQRVSPVAGPSIHPVAIGTPHPPQVDWSKLPRG